MTLYYSLVSLFPSSLPAHWHVTARRGLITDASTGVCASRGRDGLVCGSDHPSAIRSQTKAIQLHLRKSFGGQTTVWNEGRDTLSEPAKTLY